MSAKWLTGQVGSGADIDTQSNGNPTPLFISIQNGHKAIAKYLIEQGADLEKATYKGVTALSLALRLGYADVAVCLIEKGRKETEDAASPLLVTQDGELVYLDGYRDTELAVEAIKAEFKRVQNKKEQLKMLQKMVTDWGDRQLKIEEMDKEIKEQEKQIQKYQDIYKYVTGIAKEKEEKEPE